MWRGATAAFAEANAAGGVNGRTVRLVVADDAYDAEKAAIAVGQLISREHVFALFGGVGTPTIVKALPVVLKHFNSDGLFYFANFTGAQTQREPPYAKAVFNVRASYREETKAMVDAFVAMGKTRIGIFVQDDAYGTSGRDGVRSGFWPVFGTAFAVVFLAEFGDLTQFMTISLAARFHDPLAVGIGATLGLWVATAGAVTLGWRVLKLIPMKWLTRGAAVVMVILAGTSAYAAAS
jgi:putative Ca2+/H+ antiporter (TMEM165/GDT1 family)